MRHRFLFICILGCAALRVQGTDVSIGYTAYTLEVNWVDSSDQIFMDKVHLRSDEWISENYATVYSYRETLFGRSLSYEEQVELDSLNVLWDASWTLCVLANTTMDTLVIAGMSRNVKPTVDLWKGMYGDRSWFIFPLRPEPLYIIPISHYSNFITGDDLKRLNNLLDKTIECIPELNYALDNMQVHSFKWLWADNPKWRIFDQRLAALAPAKCFDRYFMSWPIITKTPGGSDQFTPMDVHKAGSAFDTLRTLDGETSIIEKSKTLEAIEITIHAQRLDNEMKMFELDGLIAYHIRPQFIGLRWEGDLHPTLWMGLDSFIDCYDNDLLEGWFRSIIANEIHTRLSDDGQ